MGKILIIKGATYTAPSVPGSGDNPSPGTNPNPGAGLNQSIIAATHAGQAINISGAVFDFGDSVTVSDPVNIPDLALYVTGTTNIYKSRGMVDYIVAIAFYDSDMNFISYCNELTSIVGEQEITGLYAAWGTIRASIPNGAKKMRFCHMNSNTGFDLPAEYAVAHLKFN